MSNSAQLVPFRAARSLAPSAGGAFLVSDLRVSGTRPASGVQRTVESNRLRSAGIFAISLSLGVGCTNQVDAYESESNRDSTHAVLKIQHIEALDGSSRGDAIAGFIKIPEGADSSHVLRLAGLTPALPPTGSCREQGQDNSWDAHESFSDAELLEADFVKLSSEAGTHDLAPHAFPTVADLLRGVVYTSRDQNAEALPSGTLYSWESRAIGGAQLSSVDMQQVSPERPSSVFVGEIPFAEILELEPAPVLDFSWSPADAPGDLVVVELLTADVSWICTFNDSEGFGSVPLISEKGEALVADGTSSRVSVHRFRSRSAHDPGELTEVKMTFDFAVESHWTFRDSP